MQTRRAPMMGTAAVEKCEPGAEPGSFSRRGVLKDQLFKFFLKKSSVRSQASLEAVAS
jgi:hypothetical protein